MTFTLPTLDELEAWWLVHPNESAEPEIGGECVVAVPLKEHAAHVTVDPDENVENSLVLLATEDWERIAKMPLTSELNQLAIKFDTLQGDSVYYKDGIDPEDDAHEFRVCSERCVELIREVKAIIAREAA